MRSSTSLRRGTSYTVLLRSSNNLCAQRWNTRRSAICALEAVSRLIKVVRRRRSAWSLERSEHRKTAATRCSCVKRTTSSATVRTDFTVRFRVRILFLTQRFRIVDKKLVYCRPVLVLGHFGMTGCSDPLIQAPLEISIRQRPRGGAAPRFSMLDWLHNSYQ